MIVINVSQRADDYASKPLRRAKLRVALKRGAARPVNPLDGDACVGLVEDGEDDLGELRELFAASAPRTMAFKFQTA